MFWPLGALPDGLLPADILENASRVSGKFGGVAGVLQGVITCQEDNIYMLRSLRENGNNTLQTPLKYQIVYYSAVLKTLINHLKQNFNWT